MLRKCLFCLIFVIFITCSFQGICSASDIHLFVDGKKISTDLSPYLIDGRVMLPVRAAAEALGAKVCYCAEMNVVVVNKSNIFLLLPVGSKVIYKNGSTINMDVPVQVIQGRTVVPVRYFAEALNCQVEWDTDTSSVLISSLVRLAVYYPKVTVYDAYLVREVHELPYTKQVAHAAINELIQGKVQTGGASRILPPATQLLGIEIKDLQATVNFSREVLQANVGAALEELGIQSIVNTLTEFPTIKKVSFMVEGELDQRVMDWWGHVGLYEQPFTRDLSKVVEPAIWVTRPYPGMLVKNNLLTVRGSAMVFEGTVQARLVRSNGEKIATGWTTALTGAPGRGDFQLELKWAKTVVGEANLEVFWISPEDGREKDVVRVPVYIFPPK
ncbi:MAG: stalk domain-containing protein [Desulfurispora sp.]|uniref:stalk domain-containing protein n=1 Tax=Desulfurispora sp. TaxID=3014275 RepID=UPI00404AC11B